MAIVELSRAAVIDLERLADFLQDNISDEVAQEFSDFIDKGLLQLIDNPFICGYSILGNAYRELTTKATKHRYYRLLYEYNKPTDTVTILAVKDAREAGFSGF